MDLRHVLLVASAGLVLTAPVHAASGSCIGPVNAQFCTDAFGNQTSIASHGHETRIQYSAMNKPDEKENNTAAMMTDSGWQTEDMPTGTTVDPELSYQLDRVSTPMPAPTR